MSTPQKQGVASISESHQNAKVLRKELKNEYKDITHNGISLDGLVQASFGLTAEDIADIRSKTWSLNAEHLAAYTRLVQAHAREDDRYVPLQGILDGVIADITQGQPNLYLHINGKQRLKTSIDSLLGPDGFFSWEEPKKIQWLLIKAYLEVKVKRNTSSSSSPHGDDVFGAPSQVLPSIAESGSQTAVASQASDQQIFSDVASTGSRKRASDEPESSRPTKKVRTSKKARSSKVKVKYNPILSDEEQMAVYGMECLVAGSRRWAFGVHVRDFEVSLWYFDRIGAIQTELFDFVKDPSSLALLMTALHRCTPAQAGFETTIFPPITMGDTSASPSPPTTTTETPPLLSPPNTTNDSSPSLSPPTRPPLDYQGAHIIVPKSIMDISSEDCCYRIDGEKPLYTYRGAVGRGTTVYAVKAIKGRNQHREAVVKYSFPSLERPVLEASMIRRLRACSAMRSMRKYLPRIIQARVFSLRHMYFPRYAVTGLVKLATEEHRRMTMMVMPLYKHLWEVTCLDHFKTIFVHYIQCHYHAATLGKVLHRDVSINNLMFLYEDDERAGDDDDESYINHPSTDESAPSGSNTPSMTPTSVPPSTTGDTTAEGGSTPKPDISEDDFNNLDKLNFDVKEDLDAYNATDSEEPVEKPQEPSGESTSEKKVRGILGDWDLASTLVGGAVPRSAAKHRTGTQPFMAMDLLQPSPPPHLYRHDLESFFYVIVWVMVHFDLKGRNRSTRGQPLSDWEGSLQQNYNSKSNLIHHKSLKELMDETQEPFKPLVTSWFYHLSSMFEKGFAARRKHESDVMISGQTDPKFDNETLGGHVTYENFMLALSK